jgi:hypothetical protein
MINLPDWTPEYVRPLLTQLDRNRACSGDRRVAFERLVNNKRMKSAYEQFFRRDRKTGAFLYPAKTRKRNQTYQDAQLAALREVLC